MRFFDFFPSPSYLGITATGFDIGDESLKYVKLRRDRRIIRLDVFGKKSIPAGIIEAGQIKNKEEFKKNLQELLGELKNEYIVASLPEEKAFIGTLQLPLMEEEEIKESLETQLEEHIPLPLKEIIFDYEIIGQNDKNDKEKKDHLDISYTAVPVVLLETYRDVLKSVGLTPVAFETEPHALVRALIQPSEKNSQMIIDFGKTRTSFIIANGRRVELSSTIQLGGQTLETAISKSLNIPVEESVRLKQSVNLLSGVGDERVFPAILPAISAIKSEAQKHLAYWKTHIEERDISHKEVEKIIFCGGDANLKGLVQYFSSELHMVTELGNPWVNIASFEDYIPELEFNDALMYSTAIGLALRSFFKND